VVKVWVHAPSLIVSEALVKLLEELGFEAQLEPEGAGLAVWNLCGQHTPFPPPPPLPTVAIVCTAERDDLVELLRLGYKALHRPDDTAAQLARAIDTVQKGKVWADENLIERAQEPLDAPRLTPREAQVLSLLTLGFSNKRIAKRLGIAEKTVKIHVSSVLQKRRARNRIDLLIRNREDSHTHR
jgi:DNA-binding NarL/FixJ family response regulator